jgi:predicted RNase H-like nuclease (RuvC/YqgF family)
MVLAKAGANTLAIQNIKLCPPSPILSRWLQFFDQKMSNSKKNRMFWIFAVSIGTALLAFLSAFLQYKEKIESSQKSLVKEQELNSVYKQLQDKSNQIIDSTNEILTLNKELKTANEKIIELQRQQNRDLQKAYDLETQANFNSVKKTFSSIFRLNPFKGIRTFAQYTLDEKTDFIIQLQKLLESELTNVYLVNKPELFNKWLGMFQLTSIYAKNFPAGEVTVEDAGETHKLNAAELDDYNSKEFMELITKYYEFERYMTDKTKGVWF